MRTKKYLFILILITAAASLSAGETRNKRQNSISWQKVAISAAENHPDIKSLFFRYKEVRGGEVKAAALPNPEADSKIMYNFDGGSLEGEVTLSQKLELGGKRGARIREARSSSKKYFLALKIKQDETIAETILLLNRLHQIKKEEEVLNETKQTMDHLTARLRRFPRLTPELKISRSLYRMTQEESGRNAALLTAEREEIIGRLKRWTGLPENNLQNISLSGINSLSAVENHLPAKSPRLALLREDISLAKAALDRENAEAIPDIGIGPSFSGSGTGSNREIAAGVSLSLPIPILNLNKGGRKIARARVESSKQNHTIQESRLKALRKNLLQRYTRLKAISGAADKRQYDSDHQSLHSQMNRGIISPSIIIEYHRQSLESIKSRYALQQEVLKLYWTIRTLDGTALKEIRHAEK